MHLECSGSPGKSRDFACSCGKDYLSYAALFTHIKQKHAGVAPGPIRRPRSQRKRGRPRKNIQENSDNISSKSGQSQNGISNLQYNQIIRDQQKTERAAQMLQCGKFLAFQAYKPNIKTNYSSPINKNSYHDKKLYGSEDKSINYEKLQNKLQGSHLQSQNHLYHIFGKVQTKTILKQCKESFLKIFQQAYDYDEINNVDWINNGQEEPSIIQSDPEKMTIKQGVLNILNQSKDFLSSEAFLEFRIFINLLMEYIGEKGLLSEQLSTITEISFLEFIEQYSKKRVSELLIGNLNPFNYEKEHPLIILVYILNWVFMNQKSITPQPQSPQNMLLESLKIVSPNNNGRITSIGKL